MKRAQVIAIRTPPLYEQIAAELACEPYPPIAVKRQHSYGKRDREYAATADRIELVRRAAKKCWHLG